jgi:hypothetical protein
MDTFDAESERCGCRFERTAPAHHRRLVALEAQPLTSLVELIEMAATWGELEYGETEPVIPPSEWIDFAEEHAWTEGDRVFNALVALASLVPPAPRTETASSAAPVLVSV